MTIVEFIEARLAEDEEIARAVTKHQPYDEWDAVGAGDEDEHALGAWVVVGIAQPASKHRPSGKSLMQQIARHDPARVLRQVKALREMITFCDMPELLASIWSDHPDYRQEWAR